MTERCGADCTACADEQGRLCRGMCNVQAAGFEPALLEPCAVIVPDWEGQRVCGEMTSMRCAGCGCPVCGRCSEESWLAECSERCPDCWDLVPEAPPP